MDPSSIAIVGPLAGHISGLWKYLRSIGYKPQPTVLSCRLMADLSRWLRQQKGRPGLLTEEQIERFLRHRRRTQTKLFTRRALKPVFDYLTQIGAIRLIVKKKYAKPSQVEKVLGEYHEYLVKDRCLGENSRKRYLKTAREFMSVYGSNSRKLRLLSAGDLSRLVLKKFKKASISECKQYVSNLRSILRYLHVYGLTSVDLGLSVPNVAGWRQSSLPKRLSTIELKKVLGSCNRRTRNGCLRYAILLLMTRLGLRATEVSALQLEDIHWRQGAVLVRGKLGRQDTLPLPDDVGRALVAYLQRRRQHFGIRSVFIAQRAPYRGMKTAGVRAIVRTCCQKVGIPFGGSHRLRHTAASEMLRQGASLPEIAQVLRHQSIDTTAIYAKIDYLSLHTLAERWLGEAWYE